MSKFAHKKGEKLAYSLIHLWNPCNYGHHRGFVKVQLNEGTYRMVGGFVDYPYIPTSSVYVEEAPVVWGFVKCLGLNK